MQMFTVCKHLVNKLRPDIDFVHMTLVNKQNLVTECGEVADGLLEDCEYVVIIWDLYPPWRETAPCLHQDRIDIFEFWIRVLSKSGLS